MINIRRTLTILFSTLLIAGPFVTFAARIYIEPEVKEVGVGDTFIMTVRLDNEGECVNTADVLISFDNTVIDAVDFSRGESLLSLWVDPPEIDRTAGTVAFSGGVPGGYCGRVIGDPGLSNILGKVIFTAAAETANTEDENVIIVPELTQVLLNDGFGTKAELSVGNAQVVVGERRSFITNEWVEEVSQDTLAPSAFSIKLHQDPSIADGQYFIVFTTNDKQSGIDHYEVFESSLDNPGFEEGTGKPSQWRKIEGDEQYYVLRDQTLKSKVIVKAVDKAGNEQIAEFGSGGTVNGTSFDIADYAIFSSILLGVLIIVIGAVMFLRRKQPQAQEVETETDNHYPYGQ
jgi:hypothetical protein